MYFRIVGGESPSYNLTLTDGTVVEATVTPDGKVACSAGEYGSIESLLDAFPGAAISKMEKRVMSMTHQITTKDGETYKLCREGGKFKFWGKTTKVIVFESFESVFTHFGELFFKKIESFEVPELLCTDSKGRYVATIRLCQDGKAKSWNVLQEDGKAVNSFPVDDLHAAMAWVLSTTSI